VTAGRPIDIPPCDHDATDCPPIKPKEHEMSATPTRPDAAWTRHNIFCPVWMNYAPPNNCLCPPITEGAPMTTNREIAEALLDEVIAEGVSEPYVHDWTEADVLRAAAPLIVADTRRKVAEEIAETFAANARNELGRPKVERGGFLNDREWAVAIARGSGNGDSTHEEDTKWPR
jgi:hypothetical protein